MNEKDVASVYHYKVMYNSVCYSCKFQWDIEINPRCLVCSHWIDIKDRYEPKNEN